ncbi:hypothetical protein E05_32130 [Plautia stali symbiont]|nr:hypothetical protein E05_32130 [Plautia stali symbiont]
MSSARLQQQFIRLWQHCQGQDQETTLKRRAIFEAKTCDK